METLIDCIRHGEPMGGKLYRGQIDDPLSEKGWWQMRSAVADRRDWQQIFTSPLSRCRDFASELAEQLDIPLTVVPALQEVGFGAWEGKRPLEIEEADPGAVARFRADPVHSRPEGAEPLADFVARIEHGWQMVVKKSHGQRVLVVGHAGQMRAVVHHIMQIPLTHLYRLDIAYAAMFCVTLRDDAPPKLRFY